MVVKGDEKEKEHVAQPPSAVSSEITGPVDRGNMDGPPFAVRHRLQEERVSLTHKFKVATHEGYLIVGLYPNGQPGELFIKMAKEGSTVSGVMDSFALAISVALQHGVPLKLLCEKFKYTRFEPSGWTGNENIGYASSIMDYIFRWLEMKFVTGQQQFLFEGMRPRLAPPELEPAAVPEEGSPETRNSKLETSARSSAHASDMLRDLVDMGDAPSCHVCGAIMTRNGSCYRCMSCGSTSGCS